MCRQRVLRAATSLDPLRVDPKHCTLEFENAQVRVLRLKIGAHEKTLMHEHIWGRVSVYLTGQTVRVTSADGKSGVVTREAGEIAWAEGGNTRRKTWATRRRRRLCWK